MVVPTRHLNFYAMPLPLKYYMVNQMDVALKILSKQHQEMARRGNIRSAATMDEYVKLYKSVRNVFSTAINTRIALYDDEYDGVKEIAAVLNLTNVLKVMETIKEIPYGSSAPLPLALPPGDNPLRD